MSITIYNTMDNRKEPFVPLQEGKVQMYVCGPTTYNYIHLGNARPIVVFDTVRRYFAYRGYDVTFISNFTDVDDKIINRANQEGKTPEELSRFYIKAFFEDTAKLNIMPANKNPKVSDNMNEIIAFVKELVDNGYAYPTASGDVYFEVRKFDEYGALSGRDIDDLMAGARIDINEEKKDPLDFALWKAAKPGEPHWTSPWGEGRPGWHIECSAMSRKYLGPTFDIHGGGQDLIFPHHENEIAQSCALTHEPMARYWMHNGFITINEEKMSKSKGNFFLLRDILERFPGDVVRYYLLSVQYRSPLDFDDEKIAAAARGLDRLKNAYHSLQNALGNAHGDKDATAEKLLADAQACVDAFVTAMDDDFNTAGAMSSLFDFVRETNVYLRGETFHKESLEKAIATFQDLLGVLGLDFDQHAVQDGLVDDLMQLFIELRAEARQEKNFALADAIRDRLNALGVSLEDGKQGTTWKRN